MQRSIEHSDQLRSGIETNNQEVLNAIIAVRRSRENSDITVNGDYVTFQAPGIEVTTTIEDLYRIYQQDQEVDGVPIVGAMTVLGRRHEEFDSVMDMFTGIQGIPRSVHRYDFDRQAMPERAMDSLINIWRVVSNLPEGLREQVLAQQVNNQTLDEFLDSNLQNTYLYALNNLGGGVTRDARTLTAMRLMRDLLAERGRITINQYTQWEVLERASEQGQTDQSRSYQLIGSTIAYINRWVGDYAIQLQRGDISRARRALWNAWTFLQRLPESNRETILDNYHIDEQTTLRRLFANSERAGGLGTYRFMLRDTNASNPNIERIRRDLESLRNFLFDEGIMLDPEYDSGQVEEQRLEQNQEPNYLELDSAILDVRGSIQRFIKQTRDLGRPSGYQNLYYAWTTVMRVSPENRQELLGQRMGRRTVGEVLLHNSDRILAILEERRRNGRVVTEETVAEFRRLMGDRGMMVASRD